MGPLNALCRPIFQRCNLTPILSCKHTHRRDTFDLRILAAHPRTILSNIPKYPVESNFANWSRSQFPRPTGLVVPAPPWGRFVGLRPSWQRGADTIIYYWPQVHPANLLQPFSAFCKKRKRKKITSSTTSLRKKRPSYLHTFPPFFATENLQTIHTFIQASGQYSQTDPLWLNKKLKIISGWNAVGSSFWK